MQLDLWKNIVSGTIPTKLGLLTELQFLSFGKSKHPSILLENTPNHEQNHAPTADGDFYPNCCILA